MWLVIELSGRADGSGTLLEPQLGCQRMDSPFGTKTWTQDFAIPKVLKDDGPLRIQLSGLSKEPLRSTWCLPGTSLASMGIV